MHLYRHKSYLYAYLCTNNTVNGHLLPVLSQGLQIMADQGFEHQHPVIVLPWRNQPQIPRIMRRL